MPSFYRHTACTKGVVTRKVSESAPCVKGPRMEEEMLGSGVRSCRRGDCKEVDGSKGRAIFYCIAKSTAVALLPC